MQNFPALKTHPLCENQRVTLQLHDDSADSPRLRVASCNLSLTLDRLIRSQRIRHDAKFPSFAYAAPAAAGSALQNGSSPASRSIIIQLHNCAILDYNGVMTWANRITLFRIFCVPAFIALMLYYAQSVQLGVTNETFRLAAIAVFAIAAISDGVDGYLARFCNQRTELGAILDPAADKLLLLGGLIVLNFVALPDFPQFPIWFTVLVISRDLFAIIFAMLIRYQSKPLEIRPHWSGKTATVFQFASIVMFLLKMEWFLAACFLGGFFSIVSGIIYLKIGILKLQE